MAAPRRYFKCPRCTKVNYFSGETPEACRQCGHPEDVWEADPQAPLAETGPTDAVAPGEEAAEAPMRPAGQGTASGALAVVSLATGVGALLTLPVLPLGFVLAVAAIVTGIIAMAGDDSEAPLALAIIGVVLGGLALLLVVAGMMWWPCYGDCGGLSWHVENHGGEYEGGGSGGSDGAGHRGGSGGSGSGGAGGGSGGGPSVEGPSVNAPGAGALLPTALALAFWRRRWP